MRQSVLPTQCRAPGRVTGSEAAQRATVDPNHWLAHRARVGVSRSRALARGPRSTIVPGPGTFTFVKVVAQFSQIGLPWSEARVYTNYFGKLSLPGKPGGGREYIINA